MVAAGRRAQRDEFVVVSDGSGGPVQQFCAPSASSHSLSEAGARWVGTSVEPAMATRPQAVVIVRSEYLVGFNNCPTYSPATIRQPQRGR